MVVTQHKSFEPVFVTFSLSPTIVVFGVKNTILVHFLFIFGVFMSCCCAIFNPPEIALLFTLLLQ